jgi:hypothetical protein
MIAEQEHDLAVLNEKKQKLRFFQEQVTPR